MKEEILEPFAAPEVYADGVGEFMHIGDMFKATFYSLKKVPTRDEPVKVAVMHLTMPAREVPDAACAAFQSVMRQKVVALFSGQAPFGC